MYLVIGILKLMIGFFCAVMTKELFGFTWGRLRYAPEQPPKWFVIVFRIYGIIQLFGGAAFILLQVISAVKAN